VEIFIQELLWPRAFQLLQPFKFHYVGKYRIYYLKCTITENHTWITARRGINSITLSYLRCLRLPRNFRERSRRKVANLYLGEVSAKLVYRLLEFRPKCYIRQVTACSGRLYIACLSLCNKGVSLSTVWLLTSTLQINSVLFRSPITYRCPVSTDGAAKHWPTRLYPTPRAGLAKERWTPNNTRLS